MFHIISCESSYKFLLHRIKFFLTFLKLTLYKVSENEFLIRKSEKLNLSYRDRVAGISSEAICFVLRRKIYGS